MIDFFLAHLDFIPLATAYCTSNIIKTDPIISLPSVSARCYPRSHLGQASQNIKMPLRTKRQIQDHLRQVLNAQSPQNVTRQRTDSLRSAQTGTDTIPQDEDDDTFQQDEENEPQRAHAPFPKNGKVVYENSSLKISAQEVKHKKYSRFNIGDHLYSLTFHTKDSNQPLIMEIEKSLELALIAVLHQLKNSYAKGEDFQVYITVLGKGIKSGLNSGNYSLRTPPEKIVRWVLSMLYNFLKSKQTMKLNGSFHVKIKVLSVEHTRDLIQRRKSFRKHVFRPNYH